MMKTSGGLEWETQLGAASYERGHMFDGGNRFCHNTSGPQLRAGPDVSQDGQELICPGQWNFIEDSSSRWLVLAHLINFVEATYTHFKNVNPVS
jgi:hypothetical protein